MAMAGESERDRMGRRKTPRRRRSAGLGLKYFRRPLVESLEERRLLDATWELANLLPEKGGTGVAGFVVNGVNAEDNLGWTASSAGDVNGDGYDDVLTSAWRADPGGKDWAGQSYVIFGRGRFSALEPIDALNVKKGFSIPGARAQDRSGNSVRSAGDVNGDGFDDIVVGAYRATADGKTSCGETYVIFGRYEFPAAVQPTSLDGMDGFTIVGASDQEYSGVSVSAAGDVNGDGFDDVIVGASRADPGGRQDAGKAYLIFGRSGVFPARLNLASLDGNNGTVFEGEKAGDAAGVSVAGVGDVNGDGFDDVMIGAYGADPLNKSNAGQAYVVFGKAAGFAAVTSLASLGGTDGFTLRGDRPNNFLGLAVSAAGDVNGDGVDDMLVSAPLTAPEGTLAAGQAYVVFGKRSGFAAKIDVASLDGRTGFAFAGTVPYDLVGISLGAAGDVNGDGFDDVMIGTNLADLPGRVNAGKAYVLYGNDAEFPRRVFAPELNGANGFVLHGVSQYDGAAKSVAGAGDVNGDGVDDMLVGAIGADPGGRAEAGQVYVIFGRRTGQVVNRRLFYNNSWHDNYDPLVDVTDDAAIAPDKTPLLPGGTARFANYSSYSRGINGLIIDIDGGRETPVETDFVFKIGNRDDLIGWDLAPAPISITRRPRAGLNGADRMTIIWEDGAIANCWLQVTVKANVRTGLGEDDVFYFGNAIGETGNATENAFVTAADEILARINPRSFKNRADPTNPLDFNRDGFVSATDQILARTHGTSAATALRILAIPSAAALSVENGALFSASFSASSGAPPAWPAPGPFFSSVAWALAARGSTVDRAGGADQIDLAESPGRFDASGAYVAPTEALRIAFTDSPTDERRLALGDGERRPILAAIDSVMEQFEVLPGRYGRVLSITQVSPPCHEHGEKSGLEIPQVPTAVDNSSRLNSALN